MQALVTLVLWGQLFTPQGAFGGGECAGVCAVDLDRDGLCDVIVATTQGIKYYRNEGDGTFAETVLYPAAANVVVAGDLMKADGHLDIFVGSPTLDFLLVNTGDDETFEYHDLFFSPGSTNAAALSDVDNDGDLDILTAGDSARLYLNDSDTAFLSTLPVASDVAYAVSCADYDNDLLPDLVLAKASEIDFYKGSQGAVFVPDTSIAAAAPRGVCWFDFEPDGDLDLAVADSAGPNLWIEQTSGGFVKHELGTLIEPSMAVAAGNFAGQSGVDLCFINLGIADRIYRGPDFEPDPGDTFGFGSRQDRSVAVADLDGINDLDMAVVGSGGNAIYKSNVTGNSKLSVNLQGRRDLLSRLSNTVAAGARVKLYEAGTLKGFWETAAGSGRAGQDEPSKSFPMTSKTNHILVVEWPRSGIIDSVNLDSDTFDFPISIDAYEDITPPAPPSNLTSITHDSLVWSNNPLVFFQWNAGSDPHGSGFAGYSVVWSNDTVAFPDNIIETTDTFGTFISDVEGNSCFFFVSSVDSVGNVSIPARYGRLKLDFHPPDSVELIEPVPYSYWNDSLIRYEWSRGTDTLSGIASYSLEVSNRFDFLGAKEDVLLNGKDTFYQSLTPLAEMWHYWRLAVQDTAGNVDTFPAQDSDTLGVRFKIDFTAPWVMMDNVNPSKGEQNVETNTTIRIPFNEPMLPQAALDTANYTLVLESDNTGIPFTVEQLDFSNYRLIPTNLLEPNEDIYVKVRRSVTDLAGNRLVADTFSWIFRTGEAPDLEGPEIDLVTIDPNPTGGKKEVSIRVRATDENHGGSVPYICIYSIDDGVYDTMSLEDGTPNSSVEVFVADLDLNVDTLANGSHKLSFQAQDRANNWGEIKIDTLDVTDDTIPPQLEIKILSDTTELYVGDTLSLEITSLNEPLRSLFLLFSQISGQDSFYRQHQVQITGDSLVFEVEVPLVGFPSGIIKTTARGEDRGGNPQTEYFDFSLLSPPMLISENVFAAPNPASGEVGFYFTPGENVDANLRVFTIDGQEAWRPSDPIAGAQGGTRSVFTTDVSTWPVGLYIFVFQVTNEQGQSAKVTKVFAVVR